MEFKVKIKTKKLSDTKWTQKKEFFVNGTHIVDYYTGVDYFGSQSSNVRNKRKNCRKTSWNGEGLSKVLNKKIKVGSTYRSGNSVFNDDNPSNSYTGSVLTTKLILDLIKKESNMNENLSKSSLEKVDSSDIENIRDDYYRLADIKSGELAKSLKKASQSDPSWKNEYETYKKIMTLIDKLEIGKIL